ESPNKDHSPLGIVASWFLFTCVLAQFFKPVYDTTHAAAAACSKRLVLKQDVRGTLERQLEIPLGMRSSPESPYGVMSWEISWSRLARLRRNSSLFDGVSLSALARYRLCYLALYASAALFWVDPGRNGVKFTCKGGKCAGRIPTRCVSRESDEE